MSLSYMYQVLSNRLYSFEKEVITCEDRPGVYEKSPIILGEKLVEPYYPRISNNDQWDTMG